MSEPGEAQQACPGGVNKCVPENKDPLGHPFTGSCTYGETNFHGAQKTFSTQRIHTSSCDSSAKGFHSWTEHTHTLFRDRNSIKQWE